MKEAISRMRKAIYPPREEIISKREFVSSCFRQTTIFIGKIFGIKETKSNNERIGLLNFWSNGQKVVAIFAVIC